MSKPNVMNVVISFNLPNEYVKKISGVSSSVIVRQSRDKKELMGIIGDADILFAGAFSPEIFRVAKRLKWVQTHLVGVDRFLFADVVESDVVITNAAGVNSIPVAEQVIGMMLCLSRRLQVFIRNQTMRKWKSGDSELMAQLSELSGKTAGIIGLGRIGVEIAKRVKCLGMRVVATRRNPSAERLDFVDEMVPLQDLKQLLKKADFVIAQVPLTSESKGMFGEDEFRSMKKTGYFVNASRGGIVKEDKLVLALREGWIAGAALDAFAVEPLPKESPLWTMENVIITPHVGGLTPFYFERLTDLFCKNLKRFEQGEPLLNVVDKTRGY